MRAQKGQAAEGEKWLPPPPPPKRARVKAVNRFENFGQASTEAGIDMGAEL
jgi:hypothetical protein